MTEAVLAHADMTGTRSARAFMESLLMDPVRLWTGPIYDDFDRYAIALATFMGCSCLIGSDCVAVDAVVVVAKQMTVIR